MGTVCARSFTKGGFSTGGFNYIIDCIHIVLSMFCPFQDDPRRDLMDLSDSRGVIRVRAKSFRDLRILGGALGGSLAEGWRRLAEVGGGLAEAWRNLVF